MIVWRPAIMELYRDKTLQTGKGAKFTVGRDGRGHWEIRMFNKVGLDIMECYDINDCCAWLNQVEAREADDA